MVRLRLAIIGGIILSSVIFAGCGGGGGSSVPASSSGSVVAPAPTSTPSAAPQPSPVPAPSPSPGVVAQTETLDPAAPTVTLPTNAGYGAAAALSGTVAAGTAVTATTAFSPPSGVAAPGDGSTPVLYSWLTFTSDVQLTGFSKFSATLPSVPASGRARSPLATHLYALEFFDPTSPGPGFHTIATCEVVGPTLVCSGVVLDIVLKAGQTYVFAFVAITVTNAPSPAPSGAPTSAPGGLTATPAGLSFLTLGTAQSFAVAEPGYTGTFVAQSGAPAIVSVSTTDGRTFTATPHSPGIASIVVSDTAGRLTTVPVTVTLTNVPVN